MHMQVKMSAVGLAMATQSATLASEQAYLAETAAVAESTVTKHMHSQAHA